MQCLPPFNIRHVFASVYKLSCMLLRQVHSGINRLNLHHAILKAKNIFTYYIHSTGDDVWVIKTNLSPVVSNWFYNWRMLTTDIIAVWFCHEPCMNKWTFSKKLYTLFCAGVRYQILAALSKLIWNIIFISVKELLC